jgi:hypothetical protein
MPRRIAYDCEFIEEGPTERKPRPSIDLVSIGLVDIDHPTDTYYAVSSEFDTALLVGHSWLMPNVGRWLPWLWQDLPGRPGDNVKSRFPVGLDTGHPDVKPRARIATEVAAFILGADPQARIELWADFGAYDHVVTSWLWGSMIGRPPGIPMWTHDLQQWVELLELAGRLPAPFPENEHHALGDATDLAERVRFVDAERARRVRILPPGATE